MQIVHALTRSYAMINCGIKINKLAFTKKLISLIFKNVHLIIGGLIKQFILSHRAIYIFEL